MDVKTVWLFPGQGTQAVGMGKAVHDASAAARDVFRRADDALGFALSKLCFDGPEPELVLTANTQPAILTVSTAVLAALKEAYPELPQPAYVAGHSLGEYSALVAAGGMTFEDAVRLVRLRGQAMQDAVPRGKGAMAAILGGDEAAVRSLCEDASDAGVVAPANFNAPGQIVIAGETEGVQKAGRLAGDRRLKAIFLNVSAPFHCSLMAPAARAVDKALESITVSDLAFPVVANATAEPNDSASLVKSLLVRQIDGPVLWEQSVRWMAAQGVTRALEIGPGRVLAGLVRKIEKGLEVHGVSDPDGIAKVVEALR